MWYGRKKRLSNLARIQKGDYQAYALRQELHEEKQLWGKKASFIFWCTELRGVANIQMKTSIWKLKALDPEERSQLGVY